MHCSRNVPAARPLSHPSQKPPKCLRVGDAASCHVGCRTSLGSALGSACDTKMKPDLEGSLHRAAAPYAGLPLRMCNFQALVNSRATCDLRSSDAHKYAHYSHVQVQTIGNWRINLVRRTITKSHRAARDRLQSIHSSCKGRARSTRIALWGQAFKGSCPGRPRSMVKCLPS